MWKTEQKKWCELEPVWNELYKNNMCASPFQSYEYLTLTGKGKTDPLHEPFSLAGAEERNFVLFSGERVVAVAPLIVKRADGASTVYLRGHFTNAGCLDLIYRPKFSCEDFGVIMDCIKDSLGGAGFSFERVRECFPTCAYMKRYFGEGHFERKPYATISVRDYDGWLSGLSKSARHKIRENYNRMRTDGVEWSNAFYTGKELDEKTNREMLRVYSNRFFEKNDFHLGPLAPVASRLLEMRRLNDGLTKVLCGSDRCVHLIIRMNGGLAAFCSYLIGNDGSLMLSRLSFDSKYGRYRPGYVLIDTLVRHVAKQNEENSVPVSRLDFSRGAEQYKLELGGETHYFCDFIS